MSIGGTPPPIPPEVLDEEREKIRKQLELEKGKSRVLYERAYQSYLEGQTVQRQGGKPRQAEVASRGDFLDRIKGVYEDAYALRAFREIMKEANPTEEESSAPKEMPSADNITTSLMKSGLPPQAINQWLKTLDPEALGALVALQSNNPNMAMMAFTMSQRQGQQQQGLTIKDFLELNVALSKTQGAVDVPKLIEALKSAPPTASTKEIIESTLEAIKTGMALAGGGRQSEEPRERGGILETLLRTPDGAKTAKELGLIGGDTPMMTIMAEMRKNDQAFQTAQKDSDRKWELRQNQLAGEFEIKREQLKESRHRTDMISGALQRVGSAIAKGLTEGGGTEGQEGQVNEDAGDGLRQYTCEQCGSLIVVPPDMKSGQTIRCAKCKAEYEITPLKSKPEEPQT